MANAHDEHAGDAHQRTGRALLTGVAAPGDLVADQPRPELTVNYPQVRAVSARPAHATVLIDARPAERYRARARTPDAPITQGND